MKHVSFLTFSFVFYEIVLYRNMNVSCESLSSSSTHMASSSVLMDNKKQRRFDNLDRYRLKILHRIHDALENEGNAFGDQTFWKLRGLFQHLENIEAAMKAYV